MRLTTAMLADAAQVAGGKLFVMGGAFDTITAREFPALHRSLSLALVAEIGPADRNRELDIMIRLVDEDGKEIGVESKGTFRVGSPATLPAGASSLVPLVANFIGVRFPEPGGYVFLIEHDGEELARVAFRLQSPA